MRQTSCGPSYFPGSGWAEWRSGQASQPEWSAGGGEGWCLAWRSLRPNEYFVCCGFACRGVAARAGRCARLSDKSCIHEGQNRGEVAEVIHACKINLSVVMIR